MLNMMFLLKCKNKSHGVQLQLMTLSHYDVPLIEVGAPSVPSMSVRGLEASCEPAEMIGVDPDAEGDGSAGADEDAIGVFELAPASCHAGIDGRPDIPGKTGGGVLDPAGARLSKSAFRDFSSCWSSASDWL